MIKKYQKLCISRRNTKNQQQYKISYNSIIMKYQKILNLLDNQQIKQLNLEINDDSRGTYNAHSQIKFKTSMIKLSLRDYSGAYILASETITVAAQERNYPDNANKEELFENCSLFTDCTSEISNTKRDNAKYIDMIKPMHNSVENSK